MQVVVEFPFAGFGKPGRHDAFLGEVSNLAGVRFHIAVSEQREWSGFAGVVARSASTKDDWGKITIEGDAILRWRVCTIARVRMLGRNRNEKKKSQEKQREPFCGGDHSRSEM